MKPLAALLLAFLAAAACAQSAYRWVGKDGKVHYSDEAPPPAAAQKVEQRRLQASSSGGGETLSYATRQAARDFPVTLYSSPECGAACTSAREFLTRRGIPHAEKLIVTPDDANAFRAATKSEMLPTLLVGARTEKGFEAGTWGTLLDQAGYPPQK